MLHFVPFFVLTSLRGGLDVAWRALHPRLPIAPVLLHHPLRLPPGTARTFLIDTVSLLPGTLSTDVREATLVLHVLTDSSAAAPGVVRLEQHVAALFGVELAHEGDTRQ
jgi:multicomponent Na+:H+ antiporter subunit E